MSWKGSLFRHSFVVSCIMHFLESFFFNIKSEPSSIQFLEEVNVNVGMHCYQVLWKYWKNYVTGSWPRLRVSDFSWFLKFNRWEETNLDNLDQYFSKIRLPIRPYGTSQNSYTLQNFFQDSIKERKKIFEKL